MSYTMFPNGIIDTYLADLSGAELKVLLYILRRTAGFGKTDDTISLSQFMQGIKTRDGRILDHGTGLSRYALTHALDSLEHKGLIRRERITSKEKGFEATRYAIPLSENQTSPSQQNRQGLVWKPDTQKIVKQKKERQDSSIHTQNKYSDTVFTAIYGGKNGNSSADPDYDILKHYIQDFALEFRDKSELPNSSKQFYSLYTKSGLSLDEFIERLYEAREKTEWAANVENKMAYFYRCLATLLEEERGEHRKEA